MTTPIQTEARRLTFPEAAAALGIANSTLFLWLRQGKIKRVLVNKRRAYIEESEVLRVRSGSTESVA